MEMKELHEEELVMLWFDSKERVKLAALAAGEEASTAEQRQQQQQEQQHQTAMPGRNSQHNSKKNKELMLEMAQEEKERKKGLYSHLIRWSSREDEGTHSRSKAGQNRAEEEDVRVM